MRTTIAIAGFAARLERRGTALLAGATSLALVAIASVPAIALGKAGRFSAWCRGAASKIAHLDAIAAAFVLVAAAAAVSVASALIGEAFAARRLRRDIAARASRESSGKLSAALAAVDSSGRASAAVVRDARPYAYTFGAFFPRVVVSTGLVSAFSREELKAVLRHELRHRDAHHPLRALLWELACRAFFFLPSLRDLADHFTLARELDADRAALDAGGRRALASALLKAVAPGVAGVSAFVAFSHPHGNLRGRIEAIGGERAAPLRLDALRAAVSVLAIVSAMSVAAPAGAAAPPAPIGSCQAEIDRQVDAFMAPFTRAFPPGPSSSMEDVQSREIGTY